jgi:hypothetical protein
MGAEIDLFYKFTRKTEIGLEEGFVGWCDYGEVDWRGADI